MNRPTGIAVWIGALRPRTLVASVVPVAVGSALAAAAGSFSLAALTAAGVGALAIQAIVNLHNDLEDQRRGADTCDRLGPARVTQKGWVSPRELLFAILWAAVFAVAAGLFLVMTAGWPLLVLGLASLVCAFAYTGGPYPLAYVGIADVFVVLFFGFGAVLGTAFAHGAAPTPLSWSLGGAVGCTATTLLVVNNLRDRHTDRRADKRTLAVRFGAGFARMQFVALWGLALGAALVHAPARPGLWGCVVLVPFVVRLCARVYRSDGAELNAALGRAAQLHLCFGVCLVFGVLL